MTAVDPAAAGGTCATSRDMAALNTRVLQTELMVAALTCGQQKHYNTFASQFRKSLVTQGTNLRAMFTRAYGGKGTSQLNTFVTRLANDASQRSIALRPGYCAFAEKLFAEAIQTPHNKFDDLIVQPWLRTRHGYAPCAG